MRIQGVEALTDDVCLLHWVSWASGQQDSWSETFECQPCQSDTFAGMPREAEGSV